jgi:hypothetical protein
VSPVESTARAILQQRIAAAIRMQMARFDLAPEVDAVHRGNPPKVGCDKFLFWGLAIAVMDDATWDALAQVRQQYVLERDLPPAKTGAR